MNTIRIYSKKAFAIGPGAQRGTTEVESFVTRPGTFQDMPDKYSTDPTFLLAVKAHEIEIIENKKQENSADGTKADIDDKASMTDEQAFYEELKVMDKEETMKLAEKYSIDTSNIKKLGDVKKAIMNAYKEANSIVSE